MANNKVTFEIKQKWWVMPLIFFTGIFYKTIHKEPSNNLCKWISIHGFILEQLNEK
jgi:hypothetical protein